jgi:hypothetical protein
VALKTRFALVSFEPSDEDATLEALGKKPLARELRTPEIIGPIIGITLRMEARICSTAPTMSPRIFGIGADGV